jgi:hypothetical protein
MIDEYLHAVHEKHVKRCMISAHVHEKHVKASCSLCACGYWMSVFHHPMHPRVNSDWLEYARVVYLIVTWFYLYTPALVPRALNNDIRAIYQIGGISRTQLTRAIHSRKAKYYFNQVDALVQVQVAFTEVRSAKTGIMGMV